MTSRREVYARFIHDTAQHGMTVLRDDGLYRHLRFRKPGTGCMGFDIVTWPGHLAICGDMGSSMFTRLPDMIEFFRSDAKTMARPGELFINPGYWSEKCEANDGPRKEFEQGLLLELARDHFHEFVSDHYSDEEHTAGPEWGGALWEELHDAICSAEGTVDAIQALDEFRPDDSRYKRFRFTDAWEYASQLEGYTFHFLWRLYAISYAVRRYDAYRADLPQVAEVDIP